MPIAVQWWAVWYPGAEPGGGSYIAQRMLASKSEKDALGATLFFNVAHYVLRPWPWIVTGLASLIIYPELSDIQKAFPHLDPQLLGHDIAFPAMLRFMPVGWIGLMLGGLIAANSSTILTHLNWGASYLVHDFYRRFLNPGKPDKHYVAAGRWCTILLFFRVLAARVFLLLQTAQDNFNILLLLGAGTGLLYLLRWFWWRITAWCEIVAMVVSFAVGITFLVLHKNGMEVHTARELIVGIVITTFCWVLTAYIGPPNDEQVLISFYQKVRPFGPGWERIRLKCGISAAEAAADNEASNFPRALLGWFSGCIMIWSALFTVGNVLYGRMGYAACLGVVFAISGTVLLRIVQRLWR